MLLIKKGRWLRRLNIFVPAATTRAVCTRKEEQPKSRTGECFPRRIQGNCRSIGDCLPVHPPLRPPGRQTEVVRHHKDARRGEGPGLRPYRPEGTEISPERPPGKAAGTDHIQHDLVHLLQGRDPPLQIPPCNLRQAGTGGRQHRHPGIEGEGCQVRHRRINCPTACCWTKTARSAASTKSGESRRWSSSTKTAWSPAVSAARWTPSWHR